MARYYVHDCYFCQKRTSQRLDRVADIGVQVLICEVCTTRNNKKAAEVPKKKTTWPYYHEGCGVRFESESHEKKYTAAHGMTKE